MHIFFCLDFFVFELSQPKHYTIHYYNRESNSRLFYNLLRAINRNSYYRAIKRSGSFIQIVLSLIETFSQFGCTILTYPFTRTTLVLITRACRLVNNAAVLSKSHSRSLSRQSHSNLDCARTVWRKSGCDKSWPR